MSEPETTATSSRGPVRIMPPVYLLMAVVAMIALHFLLPGATLIESAWRWLGAAVLLAGLALGFSAVRLFGKHQTTIKPGSRSSHLMTEGPYRITRNPIYLGMLLILAGVALMLGSATPWLVLPAFFWTIAHNVVPVEEAMMRDVFGEEYDAYCTRVRRWL